MATKEKREEGKERRRTPGWVKWVFGTAIFITIVVAIISLASTIKAGLRFTADALKIGPQPKQRPSLVRRGGGSAPTLQRPSLFSRSKPTTTSPQINAKQQTWPDRISQQTYNKLLPEQQKMYRRKGLLFVKVN
jgi:hypothetical protein